MNESDSVYFGEFAAREISRGTTNTHPWRLAHTRVQECLRANRCGDESTH